MPKAVPSKHSSQTPGLLTACEDLSRAINCQSSRRAKQKNMHTSWGSLRAAWKKKPEQMAMRILLKLRPADTRSSLYLSMICSSCFLTSCTSMDTFSAKIP